MIDLSSIIRLAQAPGVPPAAKCVVFDGHSAMSVAHAGGAAAWWAGVPCPQPELSGVVSVPLQSIKAHQLRSRRLLVTQTGLHNGAGLRTEWPADHASLRADLLLPSMPSGEPAAQCMVVLDDLDRVAIAAAQGGSRLHLQGVAFDFETGAVVGTDGHRLHFLEGGAPKVPGLGKVVLPVAAIKWLLRSKDDAAQLTVWADEAGGARALLRASDAFVFAVAVAGSFPEWGRVVPAVESCGRRFQAVSSKLAAAAEAMGKLYRVNRKTQRGLVALNAAAGRVFAADSPDFQAVPTTLAPEGDGIAPAVLMDANYLQDVADCVGNGAVWHLPRYRANGVQAPMLVLDGAFGAVVMPCNPGPAETPAPQTEDAAEPEPCPAAVAAVAAQLVGRAKAGAMAPKKTRHRKAEPVEA